MRKVLEENCQSQGAQRDALVVATVAVASHVVEMGRREGEADVAGVRLVDAMRLVIESREHGLGPPAEDAGEGVEADDEDVLVAAHGLEGTTAEEVEGRAQLGLEEGPEPGDGHGQVAQLSEIGPFAVAARGEADFLGVIARRDHLELSIDYRRVVVSRGGEYHVFYLVWQLREVEHLGRLDPLLRGVGASVWVGQRPA